ncbi:hypothetical protein E2C01_090502 [Portunus trituberculatus]|uniref:Uncharacterized protein n=1 Tax=Portunus trituberculatus TaxID=210409 RepID=A0A5B7JQI1_PORTR|nr:hypothetical protein [Portunus trituberculatus]
MSSSLEPPLPMAGRKDNRRRGETTGTMPPPSPLSCLPHRHSPSPAAPHTCPTPAISPCAGLPLLGYLWGGLPIWGYLCGGLPVLGYLRGDKGVEVSDRPIRGEGYLSIPAEEELTPPGGVHAHSPSFAWPGRLTGRAVSGRAACDAVLVVHEQVDVLSPLMFKIYPYLI